MDINAGWEKKSKVICRWFVAWQEIAKGEIAGAVAGYGGGGSFIVERFYARVAGDKLKSCWIDYTDVISGKEIEFDDCGPLALQACEDGLDEIWKWNDKDVWSDSDEVIGLKDKVKSLKSSKDMLFLAGAEKPWIKTICAKAGLTAGPGSK